MCRPGWSGFQNVDCVARTSNKDRVAENLLLIDNFATCKNVSRNAENVKAVFLPSSCVISLGYWKSEITHSAKSVLQTCHHTWQLVWQMLATLLVGRDANINVTEVTQTLIALSFRVWCVRSACLPYIALLSTVLKHVALLFLLLQLSNNTVVSSPNNFSYYTWREMWRLLLRSIARVPPSFHSTLIRRLRFDVITI
jgi:hypothetical protein